MRKMEVSESFGGICHEVFLERGAERKVWRITEAGKKVKIFVRYRVAEREKLKVDYRVVVAAPKVEVEMKAVGVVEGEKELLFQLEFLRGAKGSFGVVKDDVVLVGRGKSVARPVILSAEKEARGEHGVSVGRVDERAVGYLCARGITEKRAREMLVRAKLGKCE